MDFLLKRITCAMFNDSTDTRQVVEYLAYNVSLVESMDVLYMYSVGVLYNMESYFVWHKPKAT